MGYNLKGKNIVVTGATSGIGLGAARMLVSKGAFVIGVGRSEERNQRAKKGILSDFPQGQIEYLLADLESQAQVHSLSDNITALLSQRGEDHLDVLINNAGVYLGRKQMTEDGIERTFAINHLASFLLTHDLLPLLLNAGQGRVLAVSSYSHRTTPLCLNRIADPWPYISLMAYKRSKLCNVLFMYALNRRYDRLRAFAVDPGLVNTSITSKGSRGISSWVWRIKRRQGTSADVPARTILYLSGEENIDTSQGYYFKDSQSLTSSPKSRREDLGERLWSLSCRLTGVSWE
jgi:NAD(P)-dependent dehydrogenase (short-subunit alcohol dehydrogenase family)